MASSRGALDMLVSYGDDSSDDDVPGCRVSTKRTHQGCDEEKPAKKNLRLPVPNLVVKGCVREEHFDDSYSEKIRSFPHERGNWPTFAYISFDSDVNMNQIVRELAAVMPHVRLEPTDDFHVSLTKTIVLRHHWINPFVESVRGRIICVKRFLIILDNLQVYCNDDRTRTFISFQVVIGNDSLTKCVQQLDKCLEDFRLPTFYKVPSFHMSIFWCVGDREQEINSYLPLLNQKLHEILNSFGLDHLSIFTQYIHCKIGNKDFKFALSY